MATAIVCTGPTEIATRENPFTQAVRVMGRLCFALAVSCPHIVDSPDPIKSSNPTIHQYSYWCIIMLCTLQENTWIFWPRWARQLDMTVYHCMYSSKCSTWTSYHRDDTSFHQIYPLFFIFAGDLLSVRDLRDLRAWLVPRAAPVGYFTGETRIWQRVEVRIPCLISL
jgi:hypothetical protein